MIKRKPYKATVYSKTIKRDCDFLMEDGKVEPELSRKEEIHADDVVRDIEEHYKNLGED